MDSTPERPQMDPSQERPAPPAPRLHAAGERISESIPVEPGGTLFIDLARGSIEVHSHPKNEVRIEAEASGFSPFVRFTVETEGYDVWLDGILEGWLHWIGLGAKVRVRCWVPDEFGVDARTRGGPIRMRDIGGPVSAQSGGGQIQIDGVDGPALLRTSGGRIEAVEIDGNLDARTSGGKIEIANVDGDIDCRTSGGRIEIYGAGARVDAKTSGGGVFCSFAGPEPSGEIQTSGGAIEVLIPETAGVSIDAKTSGGGVKLDPDLDAEHTEAKKRNRVRADINGGGETLEVRTSGGTIRVRGR